MRLRAHHFDRTSGWPNKFDTSPLAGAREFCILREKSVTGVDRVGAARPSGIENALDIQVGLRRGSRPNPVCLVSFQNVHCHSVRVGVDCSRAYSHLPTSSKQSNGNFSTVGNQDFLEH